MVYYLLLQLMARVREYSVVNTPNVSIPQTTRGDVCVTQVTKATVKPVLVSNFALGQTRRVK